MDGLDRLAIGQDCENTWNELIRAQTHERAFQALRQRAQVNQPDADALALVEKFYKQIRELPEIDPLLPKPARLATRWEARHQKPLGEGEHSIDELIADVRSWIHEMGGPGISIAQFSKRPKGARARIIAAVADRARKEQGLSISDSLVERCWDEYRAFVASLTPEQT